jgi:hypothetical protein
MFQGNARGRLIGAAALAVRGDWAYESVAAKWHRRRGNSVSDSESENKQRDRQIAHNEAKREAVSSVRVSSWAICMAAVMGVIAFGIAWAWLHR